MQLVKSKKRVKGEKDICDRCGKEAQLISFKARGEGINICGKCIVELLVSFYKIYWSKSPSK